MKFFQQVVLPLAIVLALVAGAAFVSQFSGRPPARTTRGQSADEPLQFVTTRVSWDDDDPDHVREFEQGAAGHYDFWFRNPHAEPVAITPRELAGVELRLGMLKVSQWGRATPQSKLMPPDEWQDLPAGDTVEVPAADAQHGAAVGVLRLSWRGSKLGPQRLAVPLSLKRAGRGEVRRRLEVPVVIVPAIRVRPDLGELGDLLAGGSPRSVEFLCWSATRDSFELLAEPTRPCVRCDWQPLTEAERGQLAEKLNASVRSGYRVTVTVAERSGSDVLDLGPIYERVLLRAKGIAEPIDLEVVGILRGEGRIVSPGAKDRLDLGSFPRSAGTTQSLVLAVELPGQDLKLLSGVPGLQTSLEPRPADGGMKTWKLTLAVPSGAASGPLPPGSAIVLQVIGPEPRRWRIPVLGQGTQ